MAKTQTAQSIAAIDSLHFTLASGQVMGLRVACEVNYGSFGRSEVVDIWPKLTPAQQTAARQLYDKVKTLLEAEFL